VIDLYSNLQLLSDGKLYNVDWKAVKRQHDLYLWAKRLPDSAGNEMAKARLKEWERLSKLLTIPGGKK